MSAEAASQMSRYLLQAIWPAIPHPSRLPAKKASVPIAAEKKKELSSLATVTSPTLLFPLPKGPPLLSNKNNLIHKHTHPSFQSNAPSQPSLWQRPRGGSRISLPPSNPHLCDSSSGVNRGYVPCQQKCEMKRLMLHQMDLDLSQQGEKPTSKTWPWH